MRTKGEFSKKIILSALCALMAVSSVQGVYADYEQTDDSVSIVESQDETDNKVGAKTSYNVVTDFGAKGSDKADDSAAFQNALNTAKGSSSIVTVNVPSGTYYLGTELRIYSNTTLKLASDAKIIRTNDNNYFFVNASDTDNSAGGYTRSHNITIDGGIWDGNAKDTLITNGLIKIWHAKNVNISNATFKNCCGTHFIILDGVDGINVKNTTFSNFIEFTGTAASYKEQTSADYTYRATEALHMDYIPKDNLNLSGPDDGTPCKNILVTGCTFDKCTTGVGTHHVYEYMTEDNVEISNNTFKDCYFYCIDAAGFTNFKAYNNTATNTGGLIFAERTSGQIYNNSISSRTNLSGTMYSHDNFNGDAPFLNAIRISDKSDIEISSNTVKNSTGNGIYVLENSKFVIKDNTLSGLGMNGIMIYDGSTGKTYRNSVDTAKLTAFQSERIPHLMN